MLRPLLHPFAHVARSFSPTQVPMLSRLAYRWELTSAFFMPFALACVDAGVIGVIADKAFDAHPFVVATISAAPALSNVTSLAWARLALGRHRVRMIALLQSVVLGCVAIVAAAPFNAFGPLMILVGVLLARTAIAGIIVARSDVWRANYPRAVRAKVTGKLWIVTTCILGTAGLIAGFAMDSADVPRDAFRIFYAVAILLGACGIWAFSHIRWRGHVSHLRREEATIGERGGFGPRAMLGVLRDDAIYRRFMLAQFILGFPNIAAIAPFIEGLERDFGTSYKESIVLTFVLPIVMPVLVIPLWARLLDGVHVIRFRVYHSWFFVAANLLTGLGFVLHQLELLYAARILLGIAMGGGMLAWNLGHHDFASRELASIYMGVHATLTGVRGAIAPFVGVVVFLGVTIDVGGAPISLPPFGGWTFLLLGWMSLVGALLFLRLYWSDRERIRHAPVRD